MATAIIRQGPLDGQIHLLTEGVQVYWLLPENRLVANTADLTYEEMRAAIGVYTLRYVHRPKRTAFLIYRETPTAR